MSEYVDEQHEAAADMIHDEKALRLQCEQIGHRALNRTNAYGKLILFGEHFVVYKVPALVGAISDYTNCDVVLTDVTLNGSNASTATQPGLTITDHRPAVPNYKVQKAEEGEEAVKLVLDHLQIDYKKQYHVACTFGGTLTCVSGIGASAAQVVSLARALNYEIPKPMTLDEINAAGYEGEKGYHGTPSGIDNTAATFGGLLKFQRTDDAPVFTKFAMSEPIRIVYASTGITASTTTVVNDVRLKKEADPAWFDALLQQYVKIAEQAEAAILNHDLPTLGKLLNENHKLCQALTVSCSELDHLVSAALTAGALGAKMSGTGRGGLMLALCETPSQQETIAAELSKAGAAQVWKTTLA
jgi:mevalonate kinase